MPDDSAPREQRRLAAILAADVAGYSRLMGEDEAATVRELKAHQAAVLPLVARYGGRVIDTAGDGILAEFPSVINTTECAIEIQTVSAPTLVMHTRGDARVPFEAGRRMAASIPGARFVPLPGRNHLFLETEPAFAQFLEHTRAFLAG